MRLPTYTTIEQLQDLGFYEKTTKQFKYNKIFINPNDDKHLYYFINDNKLRKFTINNVKKFLEYINKD